MKTLLMTVLLSLLIPLHYLPAKAQTAQLNKFIYLPIVQKPSLPSIKHLTRITTASHPDRFSVNPSLSTDGTKILFESDSNLLNEDIQAGQYEVWMYDMTASQLTRITTASAPDRWSAYPSFSADGTQIVFDSDSDFLNQNIPTYQYEIWLYNTTSLTYTRVTSASQAGRQSYYASMSADGTKITFFGDSDFLNQGISAQQYEVWLYDTTTMTYTRITTASEIGRISLFPSISADGTKIAFYSNSDLLNQGNSSGQYEIWLYDIPKASLTQLTRSPGIGRRSLHPTLNADGTKVVFESTVDFLNQGIPEGQIEIWLYDTTAMTYTRITTASDADRDSLRPHISADGTKVAFESDSDILNQGISDHQPEMWLYDTVAMTYTRITTSPPPSEDFRPFPIGRVIALSADGTHVAFESDVDLLNRGPDLVPVEIWWADLAVLSAWPVTGSSAATARTEVADKSATIQPRHQPFDQTGQHASAW